MVGIRGKASNEGGKGGGGDWNNYVIRSSAPQVYLTSNRAQVVQSQDSIP